MKDYNTLYEKKENSYDINLPKTQREITLSDVW